MAILTTLEFISSTPLRIFCSKLPGKPFVFTFCPAGVQGRIISGTLMQCKWRNGSKWWPLSRNSVRYQTRAPASLPWKTTYYVTDSSQDYGQQTDSSLR